MFFCFEVCKRKTWYQRLDIKKARLRLRFT